MVDVLAGSTPASGASNAGALRRLIPDEPGLVAVTLTAAVAGGGTFEVAGAEVTGGEVGCGASVTPNRRASSTSYLPCASRACAMPLLISCTFELFRLFMKAIKV